MYDLEQAVRERAYHLWIEGGCQHGHANAHWLAAQREVLSASLSKASEQPLATNAKSPRKAAAKKKKSAV
ncbi:DUF2934 domain-containing protein (plasmid) [Bradyrhizobium sp. PMVTL-01]|uniref:DUF2934 domain-containing protein n=1 Tax=Bradyrhizobium sp. PMVTL-01 TaxID=3434999 RepID=UPI003F7209DF